MRGGSWKHEMKWIPVVTRLEWISSLASVLWPYPYIILRWPVWVGVAASAAACLCGVGAVVIFFSLPVGAREEYKRFLGRLPRGGGPVKNLAVILLWDGFWWYVILR